MMRGSSATAGQLPRVIASYNAGPLPVGALGGDQRQGRSAAVDRVHPLLGDALLRSVGAAQHVGLPGPQRRGDADAEGHGAAPLAGLPDRHDQMASATSMFLLCSRRCAYACRMPVEFEQRARRNAQCHAHALQPAGARGRGDWLDQVEALDGVAAGARTTVTIEHPKYDPDPQQLARHRLRPLDQRLSRLRAWLHLLLRAADPRLSRPVARRGFRIAAVRQAQRRAAAPRRACRAPATNAGRSRWAPTPIPISRSRSDGGSPARCSSCWSRPATRSRSPPSRTGCCATSTCSKQAADLRLASVALSVTSLDPKIARTLEPRAPAAAQAARGGQGAERGRRPLLRRDRAGRPADHRPRARAYRRGRGRGRRAGRLLSAGAPAARGRAAVPRLARRALSRPRGQGDGDDPLDPRRHATTTRISSAGCAARARGRTCCAPASKSPRRNMACARPSSRSAPTCSDPPQGDQMRLL